MALNGTNGDDTFRGTVFADEIFGLKGNDRIFASPGADTINGGDDVDTVDYMAFYAYIPFPLDFGDAVNVDLERAVQSGGLAQGDVLIDVENVNGSRENDVIAGNGEANMLFGSDGSDTLSGRGGDDVLKGDSSFSILFEEFGDDDLDGGEGNDQLFGEDGNDTLRGGLDSDQLSGGAGSDTLFGDPGLDVLDGGSGVDTVNYENSAAAVIVALDAGVGAGSGDAGGDILSNIENVVGSAFADQLFGTDGANVLTGGGGNDTLAGFGGSDRLEGGRGTDTATYASSSAGVVVDLFAGTGSGGDAAGDTLTGIENLIGSNFIDFLLGDSFGNRLDGGSNADIMAGGSGNDLYIVDNTGDVVMENAGQGVDEVRTSVSYALAGNAEVETLRTANEAATTAINLTGSNTANLVVGNNGNNLINGGGGADTLIGARGVDTLTGGSGVDVFVWRDIADSGNVVAAMDLIVDFNPLAGELIDLSGVDASIIAGGNQAFTFIGAAAFSGTPGEINFVQVNGETIIQLQTGVGDDVEMGIRIAGIVTPEASWFVL